MKTPDEIRRVRAMFREEASALCPATVTAGEARRRFDRAAWMVAVLTWVLDGEIESDGIPDYPNDLEIIVPNDLAVMSACISTVRRNCEARRAGMN